MWWSLYLTRYKTLCYRNVSVSLLYSFCSSKYPFQNSAVTQPLSSVIWLFHTNSYQVSWRQVNDYLMTKAVDFSKTDSKLLINHTMSLPKKRHFHFLGVGNIKFLNMKNSNFFQRRIFKLRASILGHHVDVGTDVSVPNLQPEDEGNIFPETKCIVFKATRLRCYQGKVVFSFRSLGTAGQRTSWASKIRPICCTETSLTTSLQRVTSQKWEHLV